MTPDRGADDALREPPRVDGRTAAPAHLEDGLELLSEHECATLLGATRFGRLALTIGALPAVFPIHYAMLGADPVFRTDIGTKLAAASAGAIVCLEIDAHDPEAHTGWSVMVTGPAEVLRDEVQLEAARCLPLRPWVGHGDAYVRIRAALMSGRRVIGAHPHHI